jgi:acetyltransferase-like isoleucine patch superfamily enzyme
MKASRVLERILNLRFNISCLLAGIHTRLTTYIQIDRTSQFHIGKASRITGRVFTVGRESRLSVEHGALLAGNVMIGDNCSVEIGANFKLLGGASLIVVDHSRVTLGDDCLLEAVAPFPASIRVLAGTLQVGNNGNVRGDIRVNGGTFSMGSNSFVNHGSEIRCEESVTIGDYVFVSYFVDIYDTNTHSLDWRERRQEIIDGYPNSTKQSPHRPKTAPVSLGDYVWVGKRAAILKGSHVGARSVVGTRAVVSTSCPEDSLLVGNPASVYRHQE